MNQNRNDDLVKKQNKKLAKDMPKRISKPKSSSKTKKIKPDRHKMPKELMDYLFTTYKPENALDVQEALKDMFASTLEGMLLAELDDHLGYQKSQNKVTIGTNRRNGTSSKTVTSQLGQFNVNIPRDREASFEPQVISKHQKDISDIEHKIISMYGLGQSQRDISNTIEDIYGFGVSAATISKITDKIIPLIQEFRSRPLQRVYPFVFIDAMYVNLKTADNNRPQALYNIIGIDLDGRKDILGFWLAESETAKDWLIILEELKSRGVEDIIFISLDGLTGLEKAIKTAFPHTIVQRCIVHLMRNSTRYLSRKKWSEFAKDIKAVYKAPSLDQAKANFEEFVNKWQDQAEISVKVWQDNWHHIENLFNYPAEIRKIIYTTNIIESYHNQLRKVTNRKGSFSSQTALYKLLYLRIIKIRQNWNRPVQNWGQVMNQLYILFEERIENKMNI